MLATAGCGVGATWRCKAATALLSPCVSVTCSGHSHEHHIKYELSIDGASKVSKAIIHAWRIAQDAHARALFPLRFSRFFLIFEEAGDLRAAGASQKLMSRSRL